MATDLYEYAEILPQFDTLPRIKVYYGHFEDGGAETGWAAPLAPGVALIANLPYFAPLRLYDIVTLERPETPEDLPEVGDVLQRYYAAALGITYPRGATDAETRVSYRAVRAVIEAVGGVTEGALPGWMVANLPAQDVETVLAQLAQQPGVTVHEMEAEEAEAHED